MTDVVVRSPPRGANRRTAAYVPDRTRGKWELGRASNRHAASDEAFRPYRHLAVSVLARALLDLANPAASATDRETARVFLAGSGMLFHWCRVAALDPWRIVTHAENLKALQTSPSRV